MSSRSPTFRVQNHSILTYLTKTVTSRKVELRHEDKTIQLEFILGDDEVINYVDQFTPHTINFHYNILSLLEAIESETRCSSSDTDY